MYCSRESSAEVFLFLDLGKYVVHGDSSSVTEQVISTCSFAAVLHWGTYYAGGSWISGCSCPVGVKNLSHRFHQAIETAFAASLLMADTKHQSLLGRLPPPPARVSGAGGGTRTHTPLRIQDFESSASTSSATPATAFTTPLVRSSACREFPYRRLRRAPSEG